MPPTVLLGAFAHETNTFADDPTSREDFQARREFLGDDVVEELRGTNTGVGGVVDVAEREGVDLIPTVAASASPGGVVTADAYEFYAGRILDGAREHADDIDGVVLPLHGAMVPEGMDDGEGPLVADLRDVVGEDVPIVVTHDLHGNVTDELVAEADAIVAYETYPHVDMGDTGREGMRVLLEVMRGDLDPEMAVERPPVVAYGPKQNTREGVMAEVMARARELEERPGVRKVNVFPGFSATDVPSMGFSVPVVAETGAAAREAARDIAEMVWERRAEFVGDYPEPGEAVALARRLAGQGEGGADAGAGDDEGFSPEPGGSPDGPVVLADVGDNPGGGGAADGTGVLRELLDQGVTDAGFAIMRDREVLDAAVEAGVGERLTATVGGKTDDRHGEPIADVDGYVKAVTDGRFTNTGPMGTGTETNLGRAVRWQVGADDGVDVVLTEHRVQPLDAEIWRHVGVQPERPAVLVVKSTNHYRADYEPLASHVIPVDSPGLSTMNPRRFDYERVRRPQFPLDEMADDDYPDWE